MKEGQPFLVGDTSSPIVDNSTVPLYDANQRVAASLENWKRKLLDLASEIGYLRRTALN